MEHENGELLLVEWWGCHLDLLVDRVPAEKFYNGDSNKMYDDIFRLTTGSVSSAADNDDVNRKGGDEDDVEDETNWGVLPSHWASISICTNFLLQSIRLLKDYREIVALRFSWFGHDDHLDQDRLPAILYLLVEHVLIDGVDKDDSAQTYLEYSMDMESFLCPVSSKHDPKIIGEEDDTDEILFERRVSLPKDNAKKIESLTCTNEDENIVVLPVTFIPLSTALLWKTRPKQFGTVPISQTESDEEKANPNIVTVFVSHRWKEPHDPCLVGDWERMNQCLWQVMQDCLRAAVILRRSQFSLEYTFALMMTVLDPHLKFFQQVIDVRFQDVDGSGNGEHTPIATDDCDNHSVVDREIVAKITGPLAMQILRLVADIFTKEQWDVFQFSTEPFQHWNKMSHQLARRVWLWYDFASLPQGPNRTEEELVRFRQTLQALPELQLYMDGTLSMNTDLSYFSRAWCVSEWLLSGSGECSEWDQDFSDDVSKDEAGEPIALVQWMRGKRIAAAFQQLVNSRQSATDILHNMEMEFTDEKHIDSAEIICWILWKAICRESSSLWTKFSTYWEYKLHGQDILIAYGYCNSVLLWLCFLRDGLLAHQTSGTATFFQEHRRLARELYESETQTATAVAVTATVVEKCTFAVTGSRHTTKNLLTPTLDQAVHFFQDKNDVNNKDTNNMTLFEVYLSDQTKHDLSDVDWRLILLDAAHRHEQQT